MPRATVSDVQLYYELHGPESAPMLVLNNGILMNAATSWVFQTPTLSKHYRLLQYDCRGQGQSDHPDSSFSMETHADDLASLLEHLEVKQAHIAGISYGGEVAQAFALKYPAMTQSLILADTVSEVGPELRLIVQGWIDAARASDPEAFFNATVPWNFSAKFIRENPQVVHDAKARYAMLDFPAVLRLCECFLQVNMSGQLRQIEAPTCILVGEKDALKGAPYAKILRREIAHAEYHVISEAGHATCWENAEAFNTVILGFLAKQGL